MFPCVFLKITLLSQYRRDQRGAASWGVLQGQTRGGGDRTRGAMEKGKRMCSGYSLQTVLIGPSDRRNFMMNPNSLHGVPGGMKAACGRAED